ncbi:MAG: S8 family serine peptidase, partial [Thermomicrobiales bacterium]
TPDGTPVYGSITSPGNDPSVLTVGAVDMHGTPQRSDDTIAKFSAKGPTRYDLVLKPDLVAPGVRVVSAEAQGSYFSVTYPERHYAGTAQNAFMQLSGTSMAAGVASGAVALLVDAEPKLTPGQVKAALQLTSSLVSGEGMLSSGAGSLNVAGAVAFLAEPNQLTQITIAGEPTTWGGLSTAAEGGLQLLTGLGSSAKGPKGVSRIRAQAAESIVWGNLLGMPILWSGSLVSPSASDSIVWGNASTPWGVALVRGSAVADTIVWGNAADSIVWGNAADSIVWGNAADSIVWGNAADSIVWGH